MLIFLRTLSHALARIHFALTLTLTLSRASEYIGCALLADMLGKEPDELIVKMFEDRFQFTTILERILNFLGQDKRIGERLVRIFHYYRSNPTSETNRKWLSSL